MKKELSVKSYLKHTTLWCSVLIMGSVPLTQAQNNLPSFPFDEVAGTSTSFSATINVETDEGDEDISPFNNLLLGSNVDINTGNTLQESRGPANGSALGTPNQGFGSPVLQAHLNEIENDPVVLRFPQGVFANLYNWREIEFNNVTFPADSRSSRDPIDSLNARGRRLSEFVAPASSGVRLGYPSLRSIFDRAEQREKPLDLLTVLNIIEDNEFSSRDRISSMRADGFTVRDVELGNEFFFKTQRSNTIDTEQAWLERAQEVVRVLRRNNQTSTTMRFAIPISFRAETEDSPNDQHRLYNREIVGDQSFFDAIVVHRYVRVREQTNNDPDLNRIPAAQLSNAEMRMLLNASTTIGGSIDFCKQQVNLDKRRVWLTEWGVAGGIEGSIGGSCLGMADTYLDLIKRDDMDRINWFSAFGQNEQFIFPDDSNGVSAPTGFGRVYQVIRDALRDNQLFDRVVVTSPELEFNGQGQNTKALNAVAYSENGDLKLLVTNMTNKQAVVVLRTNTNRRLNFTYENSGVRFGNLRRPSFINVSESETNTDNDVIRLSPFSVTTVAINFQNSSKRTEDKIEDTLKETAAFTVFPNPSNNGVFTLNKSGDWEAYTLQGAKIKSGEGTAVDLSGVASGLYLLNVEGQTLKLTVE